MRRSVQPRAGKAAAHGAAQAHELSLDPLDRARERGGVRVGRSESHRRPSDGDSAARCEDDRDGPWKRPPSLRTNVEALGEAPGELFRASIHGPAALQRLPELPRFFAALPAGRALLEVRKEVCRVHELQLVVVVSLDQEARRPAIHHHLARSFNVRGDAGIPTG